MPGSSLKSNRAKLTAILNSSKPGTNQVHAVAICSGFSFVFSVPQCQVFIDQSMVVGTAWAEMIEAEIRQSDFMIVLLSEHSVHSEMVEAEIRMAEKFAQEQSGKPFIIFVRHIFFFSTRTTIMTCY